MFFMDSDYMHTLDLYICHSLLTIGCSQNMYSAHHLTEKYMFFIIETFSTICTASTPYKCDPNVLFITKNV